VLPTINKVGWLLDYPLPPVQTQLQLVQMGKSCKTWYFLCTLNLTLLVGGLIFLIVNKEVR